jgi:hypothetical protein
MRPAGCVPFALGRTTSCAGGGFCAPGGGTGGGAVRDRAALPRFVLEVVLTGELRGVASVSSREACDRVAGRAVRMPECPSSGPPRSGVSLSVDTTGA